MRIWPFSSPADKITTYQKTPSGIQQIPFQSLPKRPQEAPDTVTISAARLQKQIARPNDKPPARVLAKDASVNPSLMFMAHDPKDKASLAYIEQMALVGQVEDFRVVADAQPQDLRRAEKKLDKQADANTTWITNSGGHDSWTEDHGEFTSSGGVIVPAILPEDTEIDSWVLGARAKRYFAMQDQGEKHPGCNYATQGLMNGRHAQEELVNAALSTGTQDIKLATSYVEGGNLLNGHRADGTAYALVGRDSLAVTSRLLPGQAGESEAIKQVAADYGLPPENLIPLEQPGDFHLDMAMTLAGPGQVLLNDSRQVLALQKEWISEHYKHTWFNRDQRPSELAEVEKKANKTAVFEDIVEKQLKAAGLEVFRVPGVFPKSVANIPMNFLNIRQGRNDRGETFAVSLGGEERAEKAFAHTLLEEIPAGYDRVHFLDRSWTAETLHYNGGIKCRTKVKA
ncbi:MAG: hypothetical protein KF760_22455 [Candidatus Eremiobacteraeota bacterium]|nr:hypothetical protein [Candidatus Eremiobacteraeota bacterium]MCW5866411.1 hypothetical protein [Candidatus Eremiobacteraeota bacterium]